MREASYVLTPTARQHLRETKAWSLARWGQELTAQYFNELEKSAQFIAGNHAKLAQNIHARAGQPALGIYPAREHYIVFVALSPDRVAIVAVIRQGRDISALLNKYGLVIQRELEKI